MDAATKPKDRRLEFGPDKNWKGRGFKLISSDHHYVIGKFLVGSIWWFDCWRRSVTSRGTPTIIGKSETLRGAIKCCQAHCLTYKATRRFGRAYVQNASGH
jgi:hypothetical protein